MRGSTATQIVGQGQARRVIEPAARDARAKASCRPCILGRCRTRPFRGSRGTCPAFTTCRQATATLLLRRPKAACIAESGNRGSGRTGPAESTFAYRFACRSAITSRNSRLLNDGRARTTVVQALALHSGDSPFQRKHTRASAVPAGSSCPGDLQHALDNCLAAASQAGAPVR